MNTDKKIIRTINPIKVIAAILLLLPYLYLIISHISSYKNTADKITIKTTAAPAAIGPYSQAVKQGNFLFTSGQIALDRDGKMVGGKKDIAVQTRQALTNLKTIIEAAGMNLEQVVKITCFLKNMDDFAAFNKVYAEYFGASLPARECIEAARLPKDALVEVSAICMK